MSKELHISLAKIQMLSRAAGNNTGLYTEKANLIMKICETK